VHRDVTASGVRLRVSEDGAGQPVVLIPGLVASAYAFRDIIPALAEAGSRVIVVEPLGVGFSSRPSKADYSFSAQANRIAAVLDTLGVSHPILVAHSASVAMALRLASRRPDLPAGVLAVNGGPVETTATPGVRKAAKMGWLIKLFAGNGRIRKELRKGLVKTAGDTTWITDSLINGYTAGPAGNLGKVLDGLKGMSHSREPDSLSAHLSEIQVPVRLLIGGAPNGSGIPPAQFDLMRERLPRFSFDTVPGAGLHIHEEQPAVVVNAILGLENGEENAAR